MAAQIVRTPVYEQVKNMLKKEILEGNIRHGAKFPSERELVERYGICRTTVNKAVSALVSEGLLERVVGQGTFVVIGKGGREDEVNKGYIAGLTLSELDFAKHPYFLNIYLGIEEVIHKYAHKLRFSSVDKRYEALKKGPYYLRMVKEKEIDGLLLMTKQLEYEDVAPLIKTSFPFVMIGSYVPDVLLNCILIENARGIYNITEHLIKLGHRRIGFIQGFSQTRVGMDKIKGYKLALERNGITYSDELVVEGNYLEEDAYKATKVLLSLSEPPTGIVAADDIMAVGAMEAIKDEGLKVPKDIAMVGYGDLLDENFTEPPLTTMKIPVVEMGKLATEMLLKSIRREPIDKPVKIVSPRLIVRGSCGSDLDKEMEDVEHEYFRSVTSISDIDSEIVKIE